MYENLAGKMLSVPKGTGPVDDDLRHGRNYLASTQAFSHQRQCSELTRISTASDKCRKLPSISIPIDYYCSTTSRFCTSCEGEV